MSGNESELEPSLFDPETGGTVTGTTGGADDSDAESGESDESGGGGDIPPGGGVGGRTPDTDQPGADTGDDDDSDGGGGGGGDDSIVGGGRQVQGPSGDTGGNGTGGRTPDTDQPGAGAGGGGSGGSTGGSDGSGGGGGTGSDAGGDMDGTPEQEPASDADLDLEPSQRQRARERAAEQLSQQVPDARLTAEQVRLGAGEDGAIEATLAQSARDRIRQTRAAAFLDRSLAVDIDTGDVRVEDGTARLTADAQESLSPTPDAAGGASFPARRQRQQRIEERQDIEPDAVGGAFFPSRRRQQPFGPDAVGGASFPERRTQLAAEERARELDRQLRTAQPATDERPGVVDRENQLDGGAVTQQSTAASGTDISGERVEGIERSQLRERFPEVSSRVEEQLEAETGVSLESEDIALERRDGQLFGTLSEEGEETVAVETAPLADTPVVGGLTTSGARLRQTELQATDPFAEAFREQTPGKGDVGDIVLDVPFASDVAGAGADVEAGIDESLAPTRGVSQAKLNELRNATVSTADDVTESKDRAATTAAAVGVTGVGTGAGTGFGAGAGIGSAVGGTGVGAAILGVTAVGAGFATGGVDQPVRQSEIEPGESAQDQSELDTGGRIQDQSELTPGDTQPTEIPTPEQRDTATGELSVPTDDASGDVGEEPTLEAAPQQLGQQRQRERERPGQKSPTITDEDIDTGLPEPDQPGPSIREQQRRDDLTAPERTFPTGASTVVGRPDETAEPAQERVEEAQESFDSETTTLSGDGVDVGAGVSNRPDEAQTARARTAVDADADQTPQTAQTQQPQLRERMASDVAITPDTQQQQDLRLRQQLRQINRLRTEDTATPTGPGLSTPTVTTELTETGETATTAPAEPPTNTPARARTAIRVDTARSPDETADVDQFSRTFEFDVATPGEVATGGVDEDVEQSLGRVADNDRDRRQRAQGSTGVDALDVSLDVDL